MRRIAVAILLLLVASPVGAAHGAPHVVTVRNNEFDPQRVEVNPGETVTWFAQDGGHTVTAEDGSFDFDLEAGESQQHLFSERGVFYYFCRVHGARRTGMSGVIVVGPSLRAVDTTVLEGDAGTSDAVVPVTLSRAVDHAIQVSYAVEDLTATAGADYEAVSGTLAIAPGSVGGEIRIAISGDTDVEPAEDLRVVLDAPVGAALERAVARVRLLNDDDAVRATPSPDYPTLESAFESIRPGTVVHVGAGLPPVRAPIAISVDGVIVTGDGAASIVAPLNIVDTAFLVRARGVRIERITIRRFDETGIDVRDARNVELRELLLEHNGSYNVRIAGSRSVLVRDVHAVGGRLASVAVHACEQCDVDVRGLTAERSWIGVEVRGGAGVIVRDSVLRRNANGIVLRAAPSASRAIQAGAHVVGNVIEDSGDASAPQRPFVTLAAERDQLVRGVGIWVDGGRSNVVERNRLARNRFGITITGTSSPSLDNRIADNTFGARGEWDVAWDGVGAGVCLMNNEAPGRPLETQPAAADTLYLCRGHANPGVVWPVVQARLLGS